MIRLLIVDDHALMREGLKQLFEGEGDIVVSAEAASGEEALTILQNETVDLILLDITIPGIHGVELVTKIRERPDNPPILVLSMHNEPQIAKRKLKVGASGYITKDSSPKDLLGAIRKVASGGRYIAADIAEKIAFEVSAAEPLVPHELLSGRELVILRMLAKGKKVSEIALELDISSKTVSTHKARLMQKMHIDSDVKLMQYTIAHGMTV
ncbi:MAG TPA: response regulator transcription factor [Methylobacter sp.]|jgi:DNA-binding NarL/FixJ family response regulator